VFTSTLVCVCQFIIKYLSKCSLSFEACRNTSEPTCTFVLKKSVTHSYIPCNVTKKINGGGDFHRCSINFKEIYLLFLQFKRQKIIHHYNLDDEIDHSPNDSGMCGEISV
jgi:hypothetical protein